MNFSLPQTYLITLSGLLFILAVLVGRQVFRVRKNEMSLLKLEKEVSEDSNTAEKLYELASIQLKKRLYPQASNSLQSALKMLKSEDKEAIAIIENAFGFSLAAQDRFKEAIIHYKNALSAQEEYPVAMNNLAFAKQKLLEENEACKIYQDVLKIDPKNKTALKQLKKLETRQKNISSSITYKKGF